jgi:hypothetical protein
MDSAKKLDPAQIIYIGGTGRSGTNLLKDLLSGDASVYALPFEHRILIDPEGLVNFYHSFSSAWSPYMADLKIRRLKDFLFRLGNETQIRSLLGNMIDFFSAGKQMAGPRYHGWNLAKTFPDYFVEVEKLVDEFVEFDYAGKWPGSSSYSVRPKILHHSPMSKDEIASKIGTFINQLVSKCLQDQGKSVFVEDNTWNILFAEELLSFTNQSKLIHIYRQPRDVIASLIQQRWAPQDVVDAANWYKDVMLQWIHVRNQVPNERMFELRFEDLIHEPLSALEDLSVFTSLDLAPLADTIDQSKAHVGRWTKDLTKSQINLIEPVIAPLEQELGYA